MKQNKIPRNEYIRKPVGKTNPYKNDVIYTNMGQWKYPGEVTRIPSGDITMQGVPYPVYGEDDLGNSQMMYPGMEYNFPGQYVTEYPMAMYGGDPSLTNITGHYPFGGMYSKTHTHFKKGGWLDQYQTRGEVKPAQDGWLNNTLNTIYAKLNPYNWGVPDYSGNDNTGKYDWSLANAIARARGDKEFMHNNKRYAVKDKRQKEGWEIAEENNPDFFKKYALNYLKSIDPEDYEKRYKDLLSTHYRYGNPMVNIAPPGAGGQGDYGRAFYDLNMNNMFIYGLKQNPNITKIDTADLMNDYVQELLHARQAKDLGEEGFVKHQEEDIKRHNIYYDKASNKWINYDEKMYDDPKSIEGVHNTQGDALTKRLLDRSYAIEEADGHAGTRAAFLREYKDKKFHPYENQNHLRILQKALSEEGYDMSESLKKDGTYDGIFGEQTKYALDNWQKGYTPTPVKKSNVTISAAPTYRKYGGWLDEYDEYKRGGQRRKKRGTSKNIVTSINDVFKRNYDVFGPEGRNYFNPHSKYQTGGPATFNDSLQVYNNAMAQKAYYDQFKKYYKSVEVDPHYNFNDKLLKEIQAKHLTHQDVTEANKNIIRKNTNPNIMYFLDMITGALDPDAPLAIYNKKIKPQGVIDYNPLTYVSDYLAPITKEIYKNNNQTLQNELHNAESYLRGYNTYYTESNPNKPVDKNAAETFIKKYNLNPKTYKTYDTADQSISKKLKGFITTLPYYDPLAVKPNSMLTPEERAARLKKYGTTGIGAQKPKKETQTDTPKKLVKPVVKKEEVKAIEEPKVEKQVEVVETPKQISLPLENKTYAKRNWEFTPDTKVLIFKDASGKEIGRETYSYDNKLLSPPFQTKQSNTLASKKIGGWLDQYQVAGQNLPQSVLAKPSISKAEDKKYDVYKQVNQKPELKLETKREFTPEEQAYSDKVKARINNPAADLGLLGANMASALTRFQYLTPEEIKKVTNNPSETAGLAANMMTNQLLGDALGYGVSQGLLKASEKLPAFKESISKNIEDLGEAAVLLKENMKRSPNNPFVRTLSPEKMEELKNIRVAGSTFDDKTVSEISKMESLLKQNIPDEAFQKITGFNKQELAERLNTLKETEKSRAAFAEDIAKRQEPTTGNRYRNRPFGDSDINDPGRSNRLPDPPSEIVIPDFTPTQSTWQQIPIEDDYGITMRTVDPDIQAQEDAISYLREMHENIWDTYRVPPVYTTPPSWTTTGGMDYGFDIYRTPPSNSFTRRNIVNKIPGETSINMEGYEPLINSLSKSSTTNPAGPMREAIKKVLGSPKGSKFTPSGSLSTDSYNMSLRGLPMLLDKKAVDVNFLGYSTVNSLGYLTKAGQSPGVIVDEMNTIIKNINKKLPKKQKIPYALEKNNTVYYPGIGIVRKKMGGWLDKYNNF